MVSDVGLDGRRSGDRAGDDLALHQKALDARVDQAGAEFGQEDDAEESASSPATLRKTMRRVRLEKLCVMKNCQARGTQPMMCASLLVCTGGASTGVSPSVSGSS